MTGTFLPQVRLPDMNLWEPGRQVVEEEARCYLLHEDQRAVEGEEDKRPPGGSAWVTGVSRKLRMHLDPNDYCCIRWIRGAEAAQRECWLPTLRQLLNVHSIHSGQWLLQTEPFACCDSLGVGQHAHTQQLFILSNPNSYYYWHSCSSNCTSC